MWKDYNKTRYLINEGAINNGKVNNGILLTIGHRIIVLNIESIILFFSFFLR